MLAADSSDGTGKPVLLPSLIPPLRPAAHFCDIKVPQGQGGTVEMVDGVCHVWEEGTDGEDGKRQRGRQVDIKRPSFQLFVHNFSTMLALSIHGPV